MKKENKKQKNGEGKLFEKSILKLFHNKLCHSLHSRSMLSVLYRLSPFWMSSKRLKKLNLIIFYYSTGCNYCAKKKSPSLWSHQCYNTKNKFFVHSQRNQKFQIFLILFAIWRWETKNLSEINCCTVSVLFENIYYLIDEWI